MRMLLQLSRIIDAINTVIGRLAGWLLLAAVVISATNAVVRKVFSISSNAWLDAQWQLFGAVFLLCAAYTLLKNGHVRIDLLTVRFSKRTRDLIDVIGHVFFLMPLTTLFIYHSYPFVINSLRLREASANAGGLLVWPAKMLILVGFVLLFAQAVSETIKRIAILRGDMVDPEDDSERSPVNETIESPERSLLDK
ncbi:TRAP transporter small permease subunit [Pusillimonas sp. ANT_WB101]|uniref:TRAP transporter small permease subunit n=1 Tax=Pusillimonas sp. ANT_WB101 TaxID=2597356 RepID=UPI0011EE6F35|nr:TRAP transporter small permease subunit [Pusillimonas sp. ANT_WB101]KAA0890870.1 TRAP transporter small permease subunit [Pusillimonas sp. ANT_WB101]